MSKYAPANEAGEKPYMVWKGWSGTSQLVYGLTLRHALLRAFGEKGAKAGNGRRATPEDVIKDVL
jgi:hypothetical protein